MGSRRDPASFTSKHHNQSSLTKSVAHSNTNTSSVLKAGNDPGGMFVTNDAFNTGKRNHQYVNRSINCSQEPSMIQSKFDRGQHLPQVRGSFSGYSRQLRKHERVASFLSGLQSSQRPIGGAPYKKDADGLAASLKSLSLLQKLSLQPNHYPNLVNSFDGNVNPALHPKLGVHNQGQAQYYLNKINHVQTMKNKHRTILYQQSDAEGRKGELWGAANDGKHRALASSLL